MRNISKINAELVASMYKKRKWKDVLTIISGKNQKAVETVDGKYPIYGSGGIIGHASSFLCPAKTVIIGRKGTIDRPIYVEEPFWNIDTAFGVVAGEELLPKYLYFFCLSYNFKSLDKSTGRPSVSKSDLLKIEMPLPSLKEQTDTVTCIEELFSELDKGVETLQTIKQQLAVYRQAIYHTAYTNIKHKQLITNFFEISGGLTKNSKRGELPLKYPYLRVANVYYNHLDLSEISEIGVTENEVERTTLHQDDLLFVEGNGSKSQIGRVAIWDGSIPNCLHQNHLIKGRPLGNILPKYALFYLISKEGRKQITDIAKSTSGLYTLSTNKIKSLTIPYCNLDEQKNIVQEIESRLSVCDSIEQTVDTALAQAESMRQSILKKAFEGTL